MLLANRYFDESFGDYAWSLCTGSSRGRSFSSRFKWTSLMSSIQLQYSACVYIDYNEM